MFDIDNVRSHFPALTKLHNGRHVIFLDGPGGTQIPRQVIDYMSVFMIEKTSNLSGLYQTSLDTQAQVLQTREAIADFINANAASEISFGQNMTSLTFALSRSIADTWQEGDEIIISELDHEANKSPWQIAASKKKVIVNTIALNPQTYTLELDLLEQMLSRGKTRLIAITLAANICGTITDIDKVTKLAQKYQVQLFVDAVHFAAHQKIDVQKMGCDWLVISLYKLGGPHLGALYGKQQTMQNLKPYKIGPAPITAPSCWETGTQNFEAIAGAYAALKYKASLHGSSQGNFKVDLALSMSEIIAHEKRLKELFLKGLQALPKIIVHGVRDLNQLDSRTPTFSLSIAGMDSATVSQTLANEAIFQGYGHFYVPSFIKKLNLEQQNGCVRVGFAYYNTVQEIERLLNVLGQVVSKSTKTHQIVSH